MFNNFNPANVTLFESFIFSIKILLFINYFICSFNILHNFLFVIFIMFSVILLLVSYHIIIPLVSLYLQ